MSGRVTVRMHNVGFGDAFLVTVDRAGRRWTMLVDCGAHTQGRPRPMREMVSDIVGALPVEVGSGRPRVDVVVATHHHADHIAGFAQDVWEQVEVGEVWLPFVEDDTDPDALRLREAQIDVARRLQALVQARVTVAKEPARVAMADALVANSLGNADAMDRLLGRNGRRFATTPEIRWLPTLDPAGNTIDPGLDGVRVHVLGPSRDPRQLLRMRPPANAGWLVLDGAAWPESSAAEPLFNEAFTMDSATVRSMHRDLADARKSLALRSLDNDAGLLAAASILERAVNNTSLFFVLDVAGTRLVFPGDTQQGGWDHVLDDARGRALVADAAFLKISHHGSHNGTPRRYVEEVLHGEAYAMLPWGLVKRWKDTIPKAELLAALRDRGHHVIRADAPVEEPGKVVVSGDAWSEVTFETA
jgi:beta-lactamase superfamily II metal-dependent hydrolase